MNNQLKIFFRTPCTGPKRGAPSQRTLLHSQEADHDGLCGSGRVASRAIMYRYFTGGYALKGHFYGDFGGLVRFGLVWFGLVERRRPPRRWDAPLLGSASHPYVQGTGGGAPLRD
eukprot:gene8070-biopygen6100